MPEENNNNPELNEMKVPSIDLSKSVYDHSNTDEAESESPILNTNIVQNNNLNLEENSNRDVADEMRYSKTTQGNSFDIKKLIIIIPIIISFLAIGGGIYYFVLNKKETAKQIDQTVVPEPNKNESKNTDENKTAVETPKVDTEEKKPKIIKLLWLKRK